MARGPIISSSVDLTDAGNIVQARHELHQAIDFGTDADRAGWSQKWGEAALVAGERASRDESFFGDFEAPPSVDRAVELSAVLRQELAKETPDIPKIRATADQLGQKINTIAGAYEE